MLFKGPDRGFQKNLSRAGGLTCLRKNAPTSGHSTGREADVQLPEPRGRLDGRERAMFRAAERATRRGPRARTAASRPGRRRSAHHSEQTEVRLPRQTAARPPLSLSPSSPPHEGSVTCELSLGITRGLRGRAGGGAGLLPSDSERPGPAPQPSAATPPPDSRCPLAGPAPIGQPPSFLPPSLPFSYHPSSVESRRRGVFPDKPPPGRR